MTTSSNALGTYTFAIRVVEGLELDNVGVANNPHDLKFAVLCACQFHRPRDTSNTGCTDLEALVLENALDGGIFVGR